LPVCNRSCDVRLDSELVSGVVAAQFPELAEAPVQLFGAGWDNELYSVGADWIFRFPKRAERVPWLKREIEITALAGIALGPVVPRFEHVGAPSDLFRYPFVGYRRLVGIGADESPVTDLAGLSTDFGRLLSDLHRIDPEQTPATPGGWERAPWSDLRADLTAQADVVRPLLPPDLLAKAEPYLAGEVTEPPQDGPWRFIHNDICPDHLLIDPATGRLSGLIDFTDAMIGEIVLDFVGLIGIAGYEFIGRVAASYELPLGGSFNAKLDWLARTLTLGWLADAARHDPGGISKHLSWVLRAFADAGPTMDNAPSE
jgi:aminoglycoside phosphotransferase (APT) family kinase protein